MRRPLPARIAAALAVAAAIGAPLGLARAEPAECEVPAELQQVGVPLPHLAARLRAHQPITIVAIGGASTAGTAAGSPELSYPSRLRAALAVALHYPEAAITIVNKGVPKQSAQQMLERFSTDVFAENPVLVIWEAGTVDAARGTQLDDFAATLQRGVDEVKRRAIDIVLVDMQFSHSTAAMIDFDRYLGALRRVGELDGIYVFPRYEMMQYWSEQNMFNFDVVAGERAKLAARVYDCIARRLAQAIRLAVQ